MVGVRGSKRNLLGVLIDAIDYDTVVNAVMAAAKERRPLAVSPLAVHGVMTGVLDREHRYRLNALDIVTPDGQPVRWGLNLIHGARLRDRVYGPTLMLHLTRAAAREGVPIYLYGSSQAVIERLKARLPELSPGIVVAGAEPSKFRRTSRNEKASIVERIHSSGALMVFVGLGCPRQEIFAYEYRDVLGVPVVAAGAAFDYHSGFLREPAPGLQRAGLQWAYRLLQEPGRLWKRYLVLNPAYITLLALQVLRLWHPDPMRAVPPREEVLVG